MVCIWGLPQDGRLPRILYFPLTPECGHETTKALTSELASGVALLFELPEDKFPMSLRAPGMVHITLSHMIYGLCLLESEVSHKCKNSHWATYDLLSPQTIQ